MRTIFTILVLLGLATTLKAQNAFLPGSITTQDGTQDVLIKYSNWQYTPEKISYKLTGNGRIITASIETLNEFTIDGKVSFIAADVKIDVSSKIAKQVSNDRAPKWESQRLFLKEIIGTGVKLYSFKNSKYERFFYKKIGESTYHQLIYKPYVSIQTRKSYNRDYRKQLKDNFTCQEQQVDFRELKFNYKTIVDFFLDYNSCLGYDVKSANSSRPKPVANFYLKAGIASFGGGFDEIPLLNRRPNTITSSYDQTVGVVLGFDTEIVLPQQGQQWSLLFGAHFENFKTKGLFSEPVLIVQTNRPGPSTFTTSNWDLSVSHLLLGLGVRRSFILAEKNRLFINAGINSNFAIQINSYKFIGDPDAVANGDDFARLDLSERNSLYGGFGFSNAKVSLEARFGFGREILSNIPEYKSKYTSLALIFGVQLNK